MEERRARQRLTRFTFWDPEHEFCIDWISFATHIVCATFEKGGVREIEASIIRARILDALWDITHSNDSEESEPTSFKI